MKGTGIVGPAAYTHESEDTIVLEVVSASIMSSLSGEISYCLSLF